MKKDIIIAGAGISGLTLAHLLKKKKIDSVVFEKESESGGICNTVKSGKYLFDYTGHLLHLKNSKIKKYILSLLKDNYNLHNRSAWIFIKNCCIPYPFQVHLYYLPNKIKRECLNGYLEAYYNQKNSPKKDAKNFASWAIANFGEGIAKHFLYPYNNKLWTTNVKGLNTTWLGNYVPLPDIENVLTGTFTNSIVKMGYNSSFYYPKKGGIKTLIDAQAKKVQNNIKLNDKILKIDYKNKIVYTASGEYKYKFLASSLPLQELIETILKKPPVKILTASKKLKSNRVLNINLGVRRKISNKHWVYFPENKYVFYRIGFGSNFSSNMAPRGCSTIYTEIAVDHDLSKKEMESYQKRVIKDLKKIKIIKPDDKIDTIVPLFIKPAYVIYDKNRDLCVSEIVKFLQKNDIYLIGRYGKWEYSAMEDAISSAYEIAGVFKKLL
ncbi:protoporphyrinogen/coproporphyrinogen oxidase [bacterium]